MNAPQAVPRPSDYDRLADSYIALHDAAWCELAELVEAIREKRLVQRVAAGAR